MRALGADIKKAFKETLRLLPYRTDWMVPPFTNTRNTEEEVGFGRPCLEVLMGKCTGKEARANLAV